MYTDNDLIDAQLELEEVRKNNKEWISRLNIDIKNGYTKHGIIYTSTAHRLQEEISRLKEEITTLTKQRNTIKKSLKQNIQ